MNYTIREIAESECRVLEDLPDGFVRCCLEFYEKDILSQKRC